MKKIWPLALLLFAFVGCNPEDSKNLGDSVEDLAKTSGVAAKNAAVAAKVNTALSLRKGVKMDGLHIEAKDNIVTVGGHVETKKEKNLVLEIARETKGVEKVIDDLRVEPKE